MPARRIAAERDGIDQHDRSIGNASSSRSPHVDRQQDRRVPCCMRRKADDARRVGGHMATAPDQPQRMSKTCARCGSVLERSEAGGLTCPNCHRVKTVRLRHVPRLGPLVIYFLLSPFVFCCPVAQLIAVRELNFGETMNRPETPEQAALDAVTADHLESVMLALLLTTVVGGGVVLWVSQWFRHPGWVVAGMICLLMLSGIFAVVSIGRPML